MGKKIIIFIVTVILVSISISGVALIYKENKEKSIVQPIIQSTARIRLKNTRAVTPIGKHFFAPVWSPDGQWLAFSRENYQGLYVKKADGSGEVRMINEEPGAGYGATWSLDGKEIFYQHQQLSEDGVTIYREVKSVNLADGRVTHHPNIRFNAIASAAQVRKNTDPIVFVNLDTLLVEATTSDGQRTWLVTTKPGRYYSPVLSPDKTKVLVHKGAEMFVYAVDGSGLLVSLGRGTGGSWSPNNQQILYFIDRDDGHQLTESELFVININADEPFRQQLTNTPTLHEMWPVWSPDGTRVAFSEYTSGQIYVANIEKY